jgi:hydrogenase maturation protease
MFIVVNSIVMQLSIDSQSTRILALGSPHGDDQAAWSVIDELSQDPSLSAACFKVSTSWDLVTHFGWAGDCVVIDACQSGGEPGTIRRLQVHELPGDSRSHTSSHGGSLPAAIRLAEALGYDLSRVSIYAIEAGACDSDTPLSVAARRGVAELVRRIREQPGD